MTRSWVDAYRQPYIPFYLEPRLPGGEVYTDDRAPVEWLVGSTLLEYANEE
jgi:hypothetical protein